MSPHLAFEDFDLPEEFFTSIINTADIHKAIKSGAEEFYSFVDSHKDKKYAVSRIYGVVNSYVNSLGGKSRERVIVSGYLGYVEDILYPPEANEKTGAVSDIQVKI